jgi:anti-sigma factor RsiW
LNRDEHDKIRELLTLAAAGALSPEGQKEVAAHLESCPECRAEFASWSRMAGALRQMPTPQAPMGLVERTRLKLETQAAINAERRQQRWFFFWLTAISWATTLLTWPLFQFLGGRLGEFIDLSWTHLGVLGAWIAYMLLVATVGGLAAGLLGKRRIEEERTI